MFELTLCLDFRRQKYIRDFFCLIRDEIKKDGGIIIKHNSDGKSYLSLAVEDIKMEYIKSKVLDFVTQIIEDEFKYEFFKNNLIIPNQEMLTEAFLRAISGFDEDIDKEIISHLIDFNGEIVVESLFYFKLQGLVLKWQKTADIINQNLIMYSDNSMSEVLRYLCAVSDNKSVSVEVVLTDSKLELRNCLCSKQFGKSTEGISRLFSEIIKLNPLKINIKECECQLGFDKLKDALMKVFNDKIYFV